MEGSSQNCLFTVRKFRWLCGVGIGLRQGREVTSVVERLQRLVQIASTRVLVDMVVPSNKNNQVFEVEAVSHEEDQPTLRCEREKTHE